MEYLILNHTQKVKLLVSMSPEDLLRTRRAPVGGSKTTRRGDNHAIAVVHVLESNVLGATALESFRVGIAP